MQTRDDKLAHSYTSSSTDDVLKHVVQQNSHVCKEYIGYVRQAYQRIKSRDVRTRVGSAHSVGHECGHACDFIRFVVEVWKVFSLEALPPFPDDRTVHMCIRVMEGSGSPKYMCSAPSIHVRPKTTKAKFVNHATNDKVTNHNAAPEFQKVWSEDQLYICIETGRFHWCGHFCDALHLGQERSNHGSEEIGNCPISGLACTSARIVRNQFGNDTRSLEEWKEKERLRRSVATRTTNYGQVSIGIWCRDLLHKQTYPEIRGFIDNSIACTKKHEYKRAFRYMAIGTLWMIMKHRIILTGVKGGDGSHSQEAPSSCNDNLRDHIDYHDMKIDTILLEKAERTRMHTMAFLRRDQATTINQNIETIRRHDQQWFASDALYEQRVIKRNGGLRVARRRKRSKSVRLLQCIAKENIARSSVLDKNACLLETLFPVGPLHERFSLCDLYVDWLHRKAMVRESRAHLKQMQYSLDDASALLINYAQYVMNLWHILHAYTTFGATCSIKKFGDYIHSFLVLLCTGIKYTAPESRHLTSAKLKRQVVVLTGDTALEELLPSAEELDEFLVDAPELYNNTQNQVSTITLAVQEALLSYNQVATIPCFNIAQYTYECLPLTYMVQDGNAVHDQQRKIAQVSNPLNNTRHVAHYTRLTAQKKKAQIDYKADGDGSSSSSSTDSKLSNKTHFD